MTLDPILTKFLEHGVVGLIAALAIWVAFRKDKQVSELQTRLVEQAEKNGQKYHEYAMEQQSTMKALTDAVARKGRGG